MISNKILQKSATDDGNRLPLLLAWPRPPSRRKVAVVTPLFDQHHLRGGDWRQPGLVEGITLGEQRVRVRALRHQLDVARSHAVEKFPDGKLERFSLSRAAAGAGNSNAKGDAERWKVFVGCSVRVWLRRMKTIIALKIFFNKYYKRNLWFSQILLFFLMSICNSMRIIPSKLCLK